MNKRKFLLKLKRALWGCPPSETRNRLAFYAEMIDDRVEEGLTEKEAVSDIGDPKKIAEEIRIELGERGKKERVPMGTGAKILIALGSPVWLSLLIAAAAIVFSVAVSVLAVIFSLFVCLFALLISLYATLFSLEVSGVACVIGAVICAFTGRFPEAFFIAGTGFVCMALCIWLFFACAPIGKRILCIIGKTWGLVVRMAFKRRTLK